MRLIDADLTANSINAKKYICMDKEAKDSFIAGMQLAEEIVHKAPTAEPKKGRWIERWVNNSHIIGDMECSQCHKKMLLPYSDFCPFCGAYMNGDNK